MTLDINYNITNPRKVDQILEAAIEDLQSGSSGGAVEGQPITVFGAACDTIRTFGGGSITSGSNIFTGSGVTFATTDVGKLMYIPGAGANGTLLSTTIAGFTSSTVVTLADNAGTTVTNAHFMYGTDDTSAWDAAIAAAGDNADCTIYVPYGLSLTSGVALRNNTSIIGAQSDGWAFKNLKRTTGIILKPGSTRRALFYGQNFSVGNVQLERLMLDGVSRFHAANIVRYSGATTVAGSNTVTFTNGTFTSADIGKKLCVYGAGVGGSLQEAGYVGVITGVTNVNTVIVDDATSPATYAVANAAYSYGFADQAGIDGATTATSTTFTAASANFTSADVGKLIEIYDCMLPQWGDGTLNKGDGLGEQLVTHIVSVISPTQCVVAEAIELTTTGRKWRLGAHAAIYQERSTVSQDSMWHFDKLVINYFPGNGYVCGLYQRAQRFYAVYIWQCMGHGQWVRSTDNTFIACMWAECGEDGLHMVQGSNHFIGGDSFNNEGNGVYIGGYGGQTQLTHFMMDSNGKNGLLDFGAGTVKVGCRFFANSQKKNAQYSDMSVCARYFGGVTNLNKSGNQMVGCHWVTGGNGNRPQYGLHSVGPYLVKGTGVNWSPETTPWVGSAVTSGSSTGVHQHSWAMEGGGTITLTGNNTIACNATRIGTNNTETIGFWGATPIARPTVTGAKAGNAALTSLITQLAAAGLITDSTT
jgi:hypothetical protein